MIHRHRHIRRRQKQRHHQRQPPQQRQEYGISSRRAACLLDTFSCIFQGIIPYGAQMLVAISAAAELGVALSAFQIMRYLFYPYLLAVNSLAAIFLIREKR